MENRFISRENLGSVRVRMLPCSIPRVNPYNRRINAAPGRNPMSRRLAALSAVLLAIAALQAAAAQWPDRAIRWVVPFAPGGANDLIARAASEGVARRLGQPVVIENKPGAGTLVASEYVAKSKPDGYTFLIGSAGGITHNQIRQGRPVARRHPAPPGLMPTAPPRHVRQ